MTSGISVYWGSTAHLAIFLMNSSTTCRLRLSERAVFPFPSVLGRAKYKRSFFSCCNSSELSLLHPLQPPSLFSNCYINCISLISPFISCSIIPLSSDGYSPTSSKYAYYSFGDNFHIRWPTSKPSNCSFVLEAHLRTRTGLQPHPSTGRKQVSDHKSPTPQGCDHTTL